jgi:hypothetical protein
MTAMEQMVLSKTFVPNTLKNVRQLSKITSGFRTRRMIYVLQRQDLLEQNF